MNRNIGLILSEVGDCAEGSRCKTMSRYDSRIKGCRNLLHDSIEAGGAEIAGDTHALSAIRTTKGSNGKGSASAS